MKDIVTSICNEFFTLLEIDYELKEVTQEESNIYKIKIASEDSSILIGPHGKHLESIVSILKQIIQKQSGSRIILHLEINDYLQKKDAKLHSFIDSKVSQIGGEKNEIVLPYFSAYERKKVHSYISEKYKNIETESRGEGNKRRMYLIKKQQKMTIDIDGSDI